MGLVNWFKKTKTRTKVILSLVVFSTIFAGIAAPIIVCNKINKDNDKNNPTNKPFQYTWDMVYNYRNEIIVQYKKTTDYDSLPGLKLYKDVANDSNISWQQKYAIETLQTQLDEIIKQYKENNDTAENCYIALASFVESNYSIEYNDYSLFKKILIDKIDSTIFEYENSNEYGPESSVVIKLKDLKNDLLEKIEVLIDSGLVMSDIITTLDEFVENIMLVAHDEESSFNQFNKTISTLYLRNFLASSKLGVNKDIPNYIQPTGLDNLQANIEYEQTHNGDVNAPYFNVDITRYDGLGTVDAISTLFTWDNTSLQSNVINELVPSTINTLNFELGLDYDYDQGKSTFNNVTLSFKKEFWFVIKETNSNTVIKQRDIVIKDTKGDQYTSKGFTVEFQMPDYKIESMVLEYVNSHITISGQSIDNYSAQDFLNYFCTNNILNVDTNGGQITYGAQKLKLFVDAKYNNTSFIPDENLQTAHQNSFGGFLKDVGIYDINGGDIYNNNELACDFINVSGRIDSIANLTGQAANGQNEYYGISIDISLDLIPEKVESFYSNYSSFVTTITRTIYLEDEPDVRDAKKNIVKALRAYNYIQSANEAFKETTYNKLVNYRKMLLALNIAETVMLVLNTAAAIAYTAAVIYTFGASVPFAIACWALVVISTASAIFAWLHYQKMVTVTSEYKDVLDQLKESNEYIELVDEIKEKEGIDSDSELDSLNEFYTIVNKYYAGLKKTIDSQSFYDSDIYSLVNDIVHIATSVGMIIEGIIKNSMGTLIDMSLRRLQNLIQWGQITNLSYRAGRIALSWANAICTALTVIDVALLAFGIFIDIYGYLVTDSISDAFEKFKSQTE